MWNRYLKNYARLFKISSSPLSHWIFKPESDICVLITLNSVLYTLGTVYNISINPELCIA